MAEAGATRFGRAAGDQLDCDPLALSAARMREIGYRTIDLLTERLTDRSMSAMQRGSRADLLARIPSSIPPGPRGWHELLDELDEHVLAFMSRLAHPSYFAFIPASSRFPGALGDLIASALDIDAGSARVRTRGAGWTSRPPSAGWRRRR